jgi:addiction module HigA family antidote
MPIKPNKRVPIKTGMMPAAPGEMIREEILGPLGLSISRAAEVLKVRRPTLSDICNGKARRTPDVALRIEKAFGVSMDLLLRMRASHEAARARQSAHEVDVERYRPD